MICSHSGTTCPTPNACQSHRLVICPLSAHLVPCEALTDRCEMHDLCPASSGDPVMVAQLMGEERRIVELGLRDEKTTANCKIQFPNNQQPFAGFPGSKKARDPIYGSFEEELNIGMVQADKRKQDTTMAIKDMLHVNDKIGRWLSAALEDPNACAEFKADIEAWMDEEAVVRQLFGINK